MFQHSHDNSEKTEYKNLGYIGGPKNSQFENSWLEFADEAVIISNNSQNTQQLLNIFVSWTQLMGTDADPTG